MEKVVLNILENGRKTGGNPVQTEEKVTFGRENGLKSVRTEEGFLF